MSTLTDQTKIFNKAVDRVEIANEQLLAIYTKAAEEINVKLAVLEQKAAKGLLSDSQKLKQDRLQSFSTDILEDIKKLKTAEYNIIVDGYVDNYVNTYYATGFSLSNDVNYRILKDATFDYSLGFRKLNTAFIANTYKQFVASEYLGGTIAQRTKAEIEVLQGKIRSAVTQAVAEGIGVDEFAKRLQDVDTILEQNYNHAKTVSRTELLRGYSFGQEDADAVARDSGLVSEYDWDATLDGFTRPDHRKMDKKKADEDGLFTLPDGSRASGPRMPGLTKKQSIQCRCRKRILPYGITPTVRGQRLADGSWSDVNGDLSAEEWAKTLDGKRSIEAAAEYRRDRVKRLAKRKDEGKPPTQLPPVSQRLKTQAKRDK